MVERFSSVQEAQQTKRDRGDMSALDSRTQIVERTAKRIVESRDEDLGGDGLKICGVSDLQTANHLSAVSAESCRDDETPTIM